MADSDILISALPELAYADLTDDTILTVVKGDLNYRLPMSSIKQLSLDELYEARPLGEMSLTSTAPEQTFSGSSFTKIVAFDKIQFERGMTVDISNDSITIGETGNYTLSITINAIIPDNRGIEFALMVDGIVGETLGTIQGRGNGKPVAIGALDIDPLTVGQVLTVGARDDDGGSTGVTFEKVRLVVARV